MRPFVTVSLILHNADTSFEIADYVDDNGKFVNIGTQAANAIEKREQIHFVDAEGNEIMVPFHAIEVLNITKESGEFTPAADEYCTDAKPNTTSWTVKFYNDDKVVAIEIVKDGEKPVYNGATPKQDCKTFLGWNTDSSAAEPLEELPTITEAISLYAIFEDNVYTITWMNGDVKLDDDEVACGETPAYTGETPTGTGTFSGWSATPDGEALAEIPVATADATYYAVFIV